MNNKIKSIKEKVAQEATLPDGYYNGVCAGYIIEVQYNNKTYELETENGVKGIGIKVIVQVKEGITTFDEIKNK